MTYNDLPNNIDEGSISNLYLFAGEDEYHAEKALDRILIALVPAEQRELNYRTLQGDEVDAPTLLSEITTLPFYPGRKVVAVRRAKSLNPAVKKAIVPTLENLPDFICLVFMSSDIAKDDPLRKTVKKYGRVVEFGVPKRDELLNWTRRETAKRGKKISPLLAAKFVDLVGSDMLEVSAQLDNLVTYLGDREEVKEEDVVSLVFDHRPEKVYALSDAVFERDIGRAWKILGKLFLHGVSPLWILASLEGQVKRMYQARCLLDGGHREDRVSETVGLRFGKRKFFARLRDFSAAELRGCYQLILDCDLRMKTAQENERTALELLMLKLCSKA